MSDKISAGLLMYRRRGGALEIFLAHPGGPYFRNKDDGAWGIPKGEPAADEPLEAAACREFLEETGLSPGAPLLPLGSARQRGGKTVHAWAFEGDLPPGFVLRCNLFEIEWPPRSGRRQSFPEIDRVEFFLVEAARTKINSAQAVFLDRLRDQIGG